MINWRFYLKAQLPADPAQHQGRDQRTVISAHTYFSSSGNNFGEETAPYFAEALMVSYLKSKVICSPGCVTDSPHLEAATHLA